MATVCLVCAVLGAMLGLVAAGECVCVCVCV